MKNLPRSLLKYLRRFHSPRWRVTAFSLESLRMSVEGLICRNPGHHSAKRRSAIIGATAGAATVFSLLDRPVAQESVAARTLVAPDSRGRLTASTSVAAQQPTAPTLTIPAMDMSHGTGTSPATVRGDRSHGDRRDAV